MAPVACSGGWHGTGSCSQGASKAAASTSRAGRSRRCAPSTVRVRAKSTTAAQGQCRLGTRTTHSGPEETPAEMTVPVRTSDGMQVGALRLGGSRMSRLGPGWVGASRSRGNLKAPGWVHPP
eukprot:3386722-Rhodomonas_salina.2